LLFATRDSYLTLVIMFGNFEFIFEIRDPKSSLES